MSDESPAQPSHILVIGVGNDYRGDDAVGLVVARRLKEKAIEGVKVLEESGEGAALMEAWKNAAAVMLVDAVSSGASPGTVHRWDAKAQPIPSQFFRLSTHALSVAEAVELARAMNQLPPQLIFFGVEGKNFEAGAGLSSEVEEAISGVLHQVECAIPPTGIKRESSARSGVAANAKS